MKYKRILLKLSGESLMGNENYGIDYNMLSFYSKQIKLISKEIQIAIVIGGGNIYRGDKSKSAGFDRVQGDYMGMLATIINGIALQSALEKEGLQTRMLTAIRMEQIAEPFIRRKAIRHLEKSRIVIFGGGTGNPYFTTDTAATLRAIEIEADVIIKGTRVDGIYDSDPEINKTAHFFDSLSFDDAISKNLKVMDATALTLARDHNVPINVFNVNKTHALKSIICGEKIGTLIS